MASVRSRPLADNAKILHLRSEADHFTVSFTGIAHRAVPTRNDGCLAVLTSRALAKRAQGPLVISRESFNGRSYTPRRRGNAAAERVRRPAASLFAASDRANAIFVEVEVERAHGALDRRRHAGAVRIARDRADARRRRRLACEFATAAKPAFSTAAVASPARTSKFRQEKPSRNRSSVRPDQADGCNRIRRNLDAGRQIAAGIERKALARGRN